MTRLQACPSSRFSPQAPCLPSSACWPSLAQTTLDPLASRSGGDRMLPAGQALTLRAREAGVLRVLQGRVWITFNGAHQDSRLLAGDHFVAMGETLPLAAGDGVVMESWDGGRERRATFCWEPAAAGSALPGLSLAGWRASVGEPLHDLRQALAQATGAAGRLVHGVASGLSAAGQAALAKVGASF